MMAGAKHIASLGLANMEGAYGVAMVKATNLDIVAPKEKHVRFLIQWTNEHCDPDKAEELPAVFRCLVARLEEKDCVIVIKSLVTLHRLLREGPLALTDIALARAGVLRLDHFKNEGQIQLAGASAQAGTHTLVAFARRYALYLQDRLYTWRSLGFDFLRQKPRKSEGENRSIKDILKRTQTLQRLLSTLYECEGDNLRGIPPKLAAVALLMKDAFRLYRLINEGVLEILEDYFTLELEDAQEALNVYRRFDEQTNQQIKLYKLGRELPGGYQLESLPQLKKLSDQVIPTLTDYIKQLEESGGSSKGRSRSSSKGKGPDAKKERKKTPKKGAASFDDDDDNPFADVAADNDDPFGIASQSQKVGEMDDLFGTACDDPFNDLGSGPNARSRGNSAIGDPASPPSFMPEPGLDDLLGDMSFGGNTQQQKPVGMQPVMGGGMGGMQSGGMKPMGGMGGGNNPFGAPAMQANTNPFAAPNQMGGGMGGGMYGGGMQGGMGGMQGGMGGMQGGMGMGGGMGSGLMQPQGGNTLQPQRQQGSMSGAIGAPTASTAAAPAAAKASPFGDLAWQ